jgi:hypothetical protein
MMRNYISSNNEIDNYLNIIAKSLVIKPIDTKNLEVSFIKKVEHDNYNEEYECSVLKIIVHINNKFNPINIGLFDTHKQIHIYQLYDDNTLHINMGIITFFKIISN